MFEKSYSHKIAAHAADLAKGHPGARRDDELLKPVMSFGGKTSLIFP